MVFTASRPRLNAGRVVAQGGDGLPGVVDESPAEPDVDREGELVGVHG
jgi:hypothetical protein